jgi:hypothetical protein
MGFADQWVMDGLLEVANCYNCSTHKKKEKERENKRKPHLQNRKKHLEHMRSTSLTTKKKKRKFQRQKEAVFLPSSL